MSTVLSPAHAYQPVVTDGAVRPLLLTAAAALVVFVAALVTVTVGGGTDRFDQTVYAAVLGIRTPALTGVAQAVTTLGTFPVLVAVATVCAAVLWLRTRRLEQPAMMLGGLVAVAGAVFVLKIAVARARPPAAEALGPSSWDYAFPSGHTGNGTLTWVLAAVLLTTGLSTRGRRIAVAATAPLSVAIGFSRIYLGYHWSTDVLAGWAVATIGICLTLVLGRFVATARQSAASTFPGVVVDPVSPKTPTGAGRITADSSSSTEIVSPDGRRRSPAETVPPTTRNHLHPDRTS